ncbi:hypothetical protein TrLO_g2225 [Triparma laevis f. longispina]|uniref:protein-L-isoaspartate(D-aspartate) O-methyltransferase n=1 Tax=Triparma laevis f. longispina TaxID=1714387 RepID=A0A9W7C8N0_9STRA|nr:hypothetical protein TrLO_g2225 [Triparma laevis f. longispina]
MNSQTSSSSSASDPSSSPSSQPPNYPKPAWTPVDYSTHESLVNSLNIPLDSPLHTAFHSTNRSNYAPPSPPINNTKSSINYPTSPFSNSPQPLPSKQTISSPSTHYQTLSSLLPFPSSPTILDVGCGSGILLALFLRATENGRILGIEHFENLTELARLNLKNDNVPLGEDRNAGVLRGGEVRVVNRNFHDLKVEEFGISGFDIISFGCSPSNVPSNLINLLNLNGKALIPIGNSHHQTYTLITKTQNNPPELIIETLNEFGYCRFVPMRNNKVEYGERYKRKWCYGKKECDVINRFIGNGGRGGLSVFFLKSKPEVCDLGGGYGRNVRPFFDLGCRCTVNDVCKEGLVKGEKWFENEEGDVQFVEGDGNEIEGSWDVVVCCYFDECDFEKAWERVKVGGYLLVEGFSNLHIDLPLGPSKSNLIDPIKLVETLVGSETVYQENRVRKLNEGTHHRFKEAGVFEGVFRKRWDWAGDRSEIIWRRVEDLGEGGLGGEGEDRLKLDFDVRVVKHVQAMNRLTSTTKNFNSITVGEPGWRKKVGELLEGGDAYCLFEGGELSVQDFRDIDSEEKVLLVPDGSIEQANKVYEYLGVDKSKTVSIGAKEVEEYDSKIISYLHSSAGKGRLSTAEAIGFVGNTEVCEGEVEKVIEGLEKMKLDKVELKEVEGGGGGNGVEAEDVIEYAKRREGGGRGLEGLRECVLCGCTLSNWKRREDHFWGKKHCVNVLKFCGEGGLGVEEVWKRGEELMAELGVVEGVDRVTEMLEIEEKKRGGEEEERVIEG